MMGHRVVLVLQVRSNRNCDRTSLTRGAESGLIFENLILCPPKGMTLVPGTNF